MLLEEFYSSATNRRDDDYGGSIDNRVRLISEISSGIREETKAGIWPSE